MYCIHCGNHQSAGQFCAKCGTALDSEVIGTRTIAARRQSKDYVEKLSTNVQGYGRYFLKRMKRPGEVFTQGEKEFGYAVATIVLLSIFFGLAIFFSIKEVESLTLVMIGRATVSSLLTIIIAVGSLYVTTLFVGPEQSFKRLVNLYGTQLIPSTVLAAIALLFLLLNITTLGNLLLLFALLFAVCIVPLYIVVKVLTEDVSTLDPLYSVVVYLIIFGIISYICLGVFGDLIMGDLLNWMSLSF